MTIDPAWGWAVLLGVLGLVFGSFIATLAIRWPEGRSVTRGRSACDACGKALKAHELMPVLSFVLQRGRCRDCGAAIRPSHLLVELLALVIGVSAALAASTPLEAAAGAMFGWLLLTLAALDLTAFWLPNLLTGALAATGLATGLLGIGAPLMDRLIGGAAGFGALWAVAMLYRSVRGRHGLGGGDPKMFGGIGLWLGWQALPLVLLLASVLGLAAAAALLLLGRRVDGTTRLPFGVLLAAGAFAVWLSGVYEPSYPPGTVVVVVPVGR